MWYRILLLAMGLLVMAVHAQAVEFFATGTASRGSFKVTAQSAQIDPSNLGTAVNKQHPGKEKSAEKVKKKKTEKKPLKKKSEKGQLAKKKSANNGKKVKNVFKKTLKKTAKALEEKVSKQKKEKKKAAKNNTGKTNKVSDNIFEIQGAALGLNSDKLPQQQDQENAAYSDTTADAAGANIPADEKNVNIQTKELVPAEKSGVSVKTKTTAVAGAAGLSTLGLIAIIKKIFWP